MHILFNTHVVTNLLLAVTSVLVFYKNQQFFSNLNKYFWGLFLLTISARGFVNVLFSMELDIDLALLHFFDIFQMTAGVVGLVFGGWCLTMRINAGPLLLIFGFTLATILTGSIYFFKINFLAPIIYAFCILVTLIICCVGLAAQQKSSLWLLLGSMLLAITTKFKLFYSYNDTLYLENILSVIGLICIGKAIRNEYEKLF